MASTQSTLAYCASGHHRGQVRAGTRGCDAQDLDATPDDILVLEYAAPKCGHAMPEPGYPDPANFAWQGIKAMIRISDARKSDSMNGFS